MNWKVHVAAWMASAIVASVGIAATRNLDALEAMAFPLILDMIEWIKGYC